MLQGYQVNRSGITREQLNNAFAEVAREKSRVMPVSQGVIQHARKKTTETAREETKAAEPVRVVTKAAEPANEEILSNKPKCLRCRFGCDFEDDLDNHMEKSQDL